MSILRVIFKLRFTLPFDIFPNIDRMKKVECPVLIIHSIKDEIVPFYHGKELFKAAKNAFEPLFLDGTTHNNIDKVSDVVFNHINMFLKSIDSTYNSMNVSNIV